MVYILLCLYIMSQLSLLCSPFTFVLCPNYYCFVSQQACKSDPAVLNHPAIRRFLESPSRSSSPLNQGSETPSLAPSESESLSQQGEGAERDGEGAWREDSSRQERRPGRNTGKVSSVDTGLCYQLLDEWVVDIKI